MVNSPATAATMAYPTEEERRSSRRKRGDDDYRDHDNDNGDDDAVEIDDEKGHILARGGDCVDDLEPCPVCGVKSNDRRRYGDLGSRSFDERDDRPMPCTFCGSQADKTISILNRDFTCSYRAPTDDQATGKRNGSFFWETSEYSCKLENNGQRKPSERRSRKQSQPRKVTWNQEFEEDDVLLLYEQDNRQDETRKRKDTVRLNELRKIYQRRLARRRLLKCRLCPDDSFARGSLRRPYHTKASLALHKLWRHGSRRNGNLKSLVTKDQLAFQVSSITLKATVFTSPGYGYHR